MIPWSRLVKPLETLLLAIGFVIVFGTVVMVLVLDLDKQNLTLVGWGFFAVGLSQVVPIALANVVWTTVFATITRVNGTVDQTVYFKYNVEGKLHKGVLSETGSKRVGDLMKLHFDPANPNKYLIVTAGGVILGYSFVLFGLIAALFGDFSN